MGDLLDAGYEETIIARALMAGKAMALRQRVEAEFTEGEGTVWVAVAQAAAELLRTAARRNRSR